jgi:hypothetical protein
LDKTKRKHHPNTTPRLEYKDKDWLERSTEHRRPLEREQGVVLWDDRRIESGMHWREAIDNELARCSCAVLLVSSSFLASEFLHDRRTASAARRGRTSRADHLAGACQPVQYRA